MNTPTCQPSPQGVFPLVPVNTLVSLSLGNGTRFDVLVSPQSDGLLVAVSSTGSHGGAYLFSTNPHPSYLAGKLRLLDGDAAHMADFVACQMGCQRVVTFGDYAHLARRASVLA